ncbi:hypothetical protein MRI28_31580 [Nocardiopsis dassonvillei]|uniref:hypothetical protein n=1 Tax=Nocardiopsis dassonvillei TaxID=2014 RepID=UPI00200BE9C6|nr:hypothetical protein [Nocardiopsis dassonvillei]MCK9874110.1 hypothetical protein [Nocardiopsis dassonvillei]
MNEQPHQMHLITVGISLFDKTHDLGMKQLQDALGPDLAAEVRTRTGDLYNREEDHFDGEGYLEQSAAEITALLAGQHAAAQDLCETVKELRLRVWGRQMSAELNTLAAYYKSESPRLAADDTAVLITSDTAAGLRAGLFNALIMVGGDTDRVLYPADPAPALADAHGKVVLVRLPGLDPELNPDAADRGFYTAMRTLGVLGGHLYRLALQRPTQFRFHLSGGFKAALPFLLALAEAMRTIGGPQTVTAHALHETSFDQGSLMLPLRSLNLTVRQARTLLQGADTDGRLPAEPADASYLRGFLYEETAPGMYRLTPYGASLKSLVDQIPDRRP